VNNGGIHIGPIDSLDDTPLFYAVAAGYIFDNPDPLIRGDDHYDDSRTTYNVADMARAFVYREIIPELTSFHNLESHLRTYRYVARTLGFERVPDHDTFRRTWRQRYTKTVRERITEYAEFLGEELGDLNAPEFGGLRKRFERGGEPEPKSISPGEKQAAIRHIRPLIYDGLDFDRAANASYERTDLLDLQAEISREQDYIQKAIEYKWESGEAAPWPRTHFNAINNREATDWEEKFQQVYDRQLRAAKGAGMLDRPVPVYIDGTIRPYYKRNAGLPDGVRGGEPKNGTYYGYHHTTISAHANGRSILLATYQFTPGDTMQEAVKYLIREAEKHVSIEDVSMDSAFRKTEMLKWLDDRSHEFTIQFRKQGDRVKLALARMQGRHDFVNGYHVESSDKKTRLDDLALVAEPDYNNVDGDFDFEQNATVGQSGLEDWGAGMDVESVSLDDVDDRLWKGRRAYLTNKDVESKDDAKRVIKRYNQRWTIETKYRVIKNEFLGKTTSRDFSVRTFFWLFAAMLYNAWVLLDVFLRADYPDLAPSDRPVMPARSFARRFFEVEYG
jgi:hypothetical protein